jgi:hypothetical protein
MTPTDVQARSIVCVMLYLVVVRPTAQALNQCLGKRPIAPGRVLITEDWRPVRVLRTTTPFFGGSVVDHPADIVPWTWPQHIARVAGVKNKALAGWIRRAAHRRRCLRNCRVGIDRRMRCDPGWDH